ncbi:MAG: DNA-directed RNA polymerase subunit beta [Candidatus Lernaella stagnicola]|nr:DNA-directed RNA polymerase subunit beta [Candidatus Lernaella stagnicola]
MYTSLGEVKRFRKSYARIRKIIDIPNLIDIQKKSYERFLQSQIPPDEREEIGLQGVFKSVFPIHDYNNMSSLEFVQYSLEPPKYDVEECKQRGLNFAAPFKVTIRLVVWDVDEKSGAKSIRDVKEQEVYFGEIPLMTEQGTFIINGTERVIVSQLHRSPGVFFDHDRGKTHSSGKLLYNARIIPYRGSWVDFEFDAKDILHVRIDRKRKMPATVLLKALGYTDDEILTLYYSDNFERIPTVIDGETVVFRTDPRWLKDQVLSMDLRDEENRVIARRGTRIEGKHLRRMRDAKMKKFRLSRIDLVGKYAAEYVINPDTGEVILEPSQQIDEEIIGNLVEAGVKKFQILRTETLTISQSLRETLLADKVRSAEEAMIEIYKRLRPGDPPTIETAQQLFNNLFFNPERYDLSKVGRVKMNHKLGLDTSNESMTLSKDDILAVVFYLLNLKDGRGQVDDIDHLGNRRVRAVGELVENQYRIGLVRMERAIRERMSLQEIDTLMPHDLINAKPVSAVIKEFFGSSQLSQFMDQTNPLSEVTHKRRLSALGPGGLTRERAGFEVRDVHNTHYGRICPVETPEGPNIGLIASLSTFARVNDLGFIETPYRPVENGRVSEGAEFLTALQEERYTIAQANAPLDRNNKFARSIVSARAAGEVELVGAEQVDYMDVSPQQLVSVAASLIPFLEHDDANRALMGSNMQRQAVPLLKTRAPLVGTGIEEVVARDSGVTQVARRGGRVHSVDADRIVVKVAEDEKDPTEAGVDIYNLTKFQRSNQNTCINQKPIVSVGERVYRGQVLADGPSTDMGELALGKNVVVAFMPWQGYNFEDSILISERLIKDDRFTSVHVEVFECVSRDTKLGKEEITRDIPNVSEEALRNLDESGIIRIGAEVKPGDILVGKITPKGETQLSPEEKLLRAIFGEKAGDVRDTSLTVPPGVVGTVTDAKVFSRKGVDKDQRAREIEDEQIAKILGDQETEIRIITESALKSLKDMLINKTVTAALLDEDENEVLLKKGQRITVELLDEIDFEKIAELSLADTKLETRIRELVINVTKQVEAVKEFFESKIERLKRSDEMAPGVIKMVKVYVAIKRKLSVGDKMAGRHGNKGVLSRILPEEDMPYLPDGTPVEMILNPLGVPSRMNVGQILEVHLGWAARHLGEQIQHVLEQSFNAGKLRKQLLAVFETENETNRKIRDLISGAKDDDIVKFCYGWDEGLFLATPVFDGAPEAEIKVALVNAGLRRDGQTTLFDGRNGVPFDTDVTVGIMYMLKLHHLVDDKIHARSIGPYSLVTQQPLGGKAQFGGQRLGEMEVWAMEAYGAAYSLQEFLTVKSDDVAGRTRMYESIIKGECELEPGLPESFNVLVKELQSLCLDVELLEEEMEEEAEVDEATKVRADFDALFAKPSFDSDLGPGSLSQPITPEKETKE